MHQTMTQQDIIALAQNGDEKAFNVLYQTYNQKM